MKRYARNPCPYNGEMVSYHDCARYAGKVPTSSPAGPAPLAGVPEMQI